MIDLQEGVLTEFSEAAEKGKRFFLPGEGFDQKTYVLGNREKVVDTTSFPEEAARLQRVADWVSRNLQEGIDRRKERNWRYVADYRRRVDAELKAKRRVYVISVYGARWVSK